VDLITILIIAIVALLVIGIFVVPGIILVRAGEVGIVTKKMFGKKLPQGKIVSTQGEIGLQFGNCQPTDALINKISLKTRYFMFRFHIGVSRIKGYYMRVKAPMCDNSKCGLTMMRVYIRPTHSGSFFTFLGIAE